MTQERSFKWDPKNKEYILEVKSKEDIKDDAGEVIGEGETITKQRWSEKGIEDLKKQIDDQKKKFENALSETDKQIKQLGNVKTRERQRLSKFMKDLEAGQKLQKIQKLEQQKENQKKMVESVEKDLKELNNAKSA